MAGATALVALASSPALTAAGPSDIFQSVGDFLKSQMDKLNGAITPSKATQRNQYWNEDILKRWRPSGSQNRSPCPMLNALANYDILNYDGKNINATSVQFALENMLGLRGAMLKFLMRAPGHLAEIHAENHPDKPKNPDNIKHGIFDLKDALKHNFIEHDVSLSRERRTAADPERALNVSKKRLAKLREFAEDGMLTYNSIAKFRKHMRAEEEKDGLQPPMHFSLDNQFKAHGEAVLLLEVVGRNGKIAIDDAVYFFEHERLPPNFVPLPPSSTSDVYMIGRLVQEFSLFNTLQFLGYNSMSEKQELVQQIERELQAVPQ
ncbi:Chloroperoxidase [Syncephalis pseudoplumigaleata]|uniref:Chloroperoxidase n=1 Tax=Syncephalis pseudoplumigaleata TaxID=1712513 RepID=A0A4P9YVP9_9FUNG|nr:Chloroperoxidase [Syncephalis pseudoplumigaleata]|eukprot:RKP23974.1 Chloroperoxidase [Syncephalis pseudoplumigaleata]